MADPWPLNPEGELLLGIKIEHKDVVQHAGVLAGVPGIGITEWGPADMVMSMGLPGEVDPPYAPEAQYAMETVRAALAAANVPFHCGWSDPSMSVEQ